MEAHESNQLGHYEDLDFVRLQEQILIENNISSTGYGAWFVNTTLTPLCVQKSLDLLQNRANNYLFWGWKDPRTVLLLDHWVGLIPGVRFLFLFRDPAQVVRSLLARGEARFQDDGDMALREWLSYNRRLRDFVIQYPQHVLLQNASSLDRDFDCFIVRLQRLTGVSAPCDPSVFRPELMRSSGHLPQAAFARSLIDRCYELYEELKDYADRDQPSAPIQLPTPAVNRAAVVVPMHRLPLSLTEQVSLAQIEYFLPHHDIILLKPNSLDVSRFRHASISFADHWFQSVRTYSNLMLTPELYSAFESYGYILVCQLDALVLSEALHDWCERGWDYVGAPWLTDFGGMPSLGIWRAGNGGFSLRRPGRLRHLLCTDAAQSRLSQVDYAEDLFWSFDAPHIDPSFRIPGAEEACSFAAESVPRHIFRLLGNRLPFGCHYWHKVDPEFWREHLSPNARELLDSSQASVFDNPSHPDYLWSRRWVSLLLRSLVAGSDPVAVGQHLLSDLPDGCLDSIPTETGMNLVFERILQREPNAEWLAFWVGRHDAILQDVANDLLRGPEFSERLSKIDRVASMLSLPTSPDIDSVSNG
ncbi:MAG: DUF5672 family protein [Cyanobacteriota bacterium]|nr:DUF5672 family protein [Cyanobacteriota bacterium]